MPNTPDDQYFNRADAHIRLSHQQVLLFGEPKTLDSMIYASAWYGTWLASKSAGSKEALEAQAAAETERLTHAFREATEAAMADVIARFEILNSKG